MQLLMAARKGLAVAALLLTVMAVLQASPASHSTAQVGSVPTSLELVVAPATLPADGGTYPSIFVSLRDVSGQPTLAAANTTVTLTSSDPAVGSVLNSSIVIPAGRDFAVVDFESTGAAGQTEITASATGYTTSTAEVTTSVPRGYPTAISLSAVPSDINSTSLRSGTLIVELQDDAGLPAKAVQDTSVSLYSSSSDIVNLTGLSVSISAGQFLGLATFKAGFVPGVASVTASAPGLASGSAQITVLGRTPLALKLYAQPSYMVTCETPEVASCTGRLVIALTDTNGNPALAPHDITVYIRSSDLGVVVPQYSATIPAGSLSVDASFNSTANEGVAEITVSSPGLQSDFAYVHTGNLAGTLTGIQLYVGPAVVLSNDRSYSSVVVSLVNQTGAGSVNDTGPTSVVLTSSRSDVGGITPLFLTIPQGVNYASALFLSTFQVGKTVLTASAHNLLPDQATLSTYGAVPAQVTISSLFPTILADGAVHPALEVSLQDSHGAPAVAGNPGVLVYLTSVPSGILQVDPVTIEPGQSAALVNVTTSAASGTATVTAYIESSSSGYTSSFATIKTVTPSPSGIGAYVSPSTFVQSPSGTPAMLILQLQDSSGNPATARELTNLTVTSSNAQVYNRTLQTRIEQGASYVEVPIVPLSTGSTVFTISSVGLASGTTQLQVNPQSYVEQLFSSSLIIFANQSATLTLTLSIDGQGLQGANVGWSAVGGTVAPSNSTTNSQGEATATFTPTSVGVANVTAILTSTATGTKTLKSEIGVNPVPPRHSRNLIALLFTFPFYLILAGAVAGAAIVAIVLVRRRGRGGESEEEQGDFMIFRLPRLPKGGFADIARTLR